CCHFVLMRVKLVAMACCDGRNSACPDAGGRPMATPQKEIRLLSTSAILGYGFPEASLRAGMERAPHVIGVDGGSVDPGPHYLGSGKPFCSPIAIRRDLRLMLNAAVRAGIPVVIGTCGGAGAAPHLDLV